MFDRTEHHDRAKLNIVIDEQHDIRQSRNEQKTKTFTFPSSRLKKHFRIILATDRTVK